MPYALARFALHEQLSLAPFGLGLRLHAGHRGNAARQRTHSQTERNGRREVAPMTMGEHSTVTLDAASPTDGSLCPARPHAGAGAGAATLHARPRGRPPRPLALLIRAQRRDSKNLRECWGAGCGAGATAAARSQHTHQIALGAANLGHAIAIWAGKRAARGASILLPDRAQSSYRSRPIAPPLSRSVRPPRRPPARPPAPAACRQAGGGEASASLAAAQRCAARLLRRLPCAPGVRRDG